MGTAHTIIFFACLAAFRLDVWNNENCAVTQENDVPKDIIQRTLNEMGHTKAWTKLNAHEKLMVFSRLVERKEHMEKDWTQNVSCIMENWAQNASRIMENWAQNASRIMENWAQNASLAQKDLERLKSIGMRISLPTYICMKFELYETAWNTGGPTSADFNKTMVPSKLPDNSQACYKKHHAAWNKILTGSCDPGAKAFVRALRAAYGEEYNAEVISRNIAVAIVFLQNCKHGPSAREAGLEFLNDAKMFTKVLSDWRVLEDPRLLDIVELFENVTTGNCGI